MFARDHTAAGAVIAIGIANHVPSALDAAVIVIPAAIASHFALDLIKEHDFGSVRVNAAIEVAFLVAIGAIIFAAQYHGPTLAVILAGIVAANLPDITDSHVYRTYIDPARWPHRRWWWCHHDSWSIVRASALATLAISALLAFSLYAMTVL